MKILLAAKHAPHGSRPIGGVQTWCRTVCKELQKLGHETHTWGPEQPDPGNFDFGIIANAQDTSRAFSWCNLVLNVTHGIIAAENPANNYAVHTSEEIKDFWKTDGPIIRQPIDMEFWKPLKTKKKYLTRFSYRSGLPWLANLAKDLKLEYRHVRNMTPLQAREIINQSVCVIATGRAALEAMSCGVPVVICDHRSAYQDPLINTDLYDAMYKNYSGRGGIRPNIGIVKTAIKRSIDEGSLRKHVKSHHESGAITKQILEASIHQMAPA